jgi:hypothetical protein
LVFNGGTGAAGVHFGRLFSAGARHRAAFDAKPAGHATQERHHHLQHGPGAGLRSGGATGKLLLPRERIKVPIKSYDSNNLLQTIKYIHTNNVTVIGCGAVDYSDNPNAVQVI